MAEKLRAFRYLGAFGAPDDRKGVLHIDRPDDKIRPRRVVRPGELVKDPLNLEKLGAARIQELVDEGQAEYLDVLEKLGFEAALAKGKVGDDSSKEEVDTAAQAATDAAKMNIGKKAIADAQIASGAAQSDARLTGESMGPGGNRVAPTPPISTDPEPDILGGAAGPKA